MKSIYRRLRNSLKNEKGAMSIYGEIAAIGLAVLALVGGTMVFINFLDMGKDANAQGDLGRIDIAQNSLVAVGGNFTDDITDLMDGGNNIQFVPSQGVEFALDASASGYVAVTKSESGKYFAKISDSSKLGSGDTIEAALTDAGATTAWASSHSITLPTATTLVASGGNNSEDDDSGSEEPASYVFPKPISTEWDYSWATAETPTLFICDSLVNEECGAHTQLKGLANLSSTMHTPYWKTVVVHSNTAPEFLAQVCMDTGESIGKFMEFELTDYPGWYEVNLFSELPCAEQWIAIPYLPDDEAEAFVYVS